MQVIYKQVATEYVSRTVEVYKEGDGYHFNIYENDGLIHCQADKVFRGEEVPELLCRPFKTAAHALSAGNKLAASRTLKKM